MKGSEELINESSALIQFLKKHELISLNALESKLNIPQSTLYKAVKGHRTIPIGYWYKLSLELRSYGYHIEDYIQVEVIDEDEPVLKTAFEIASHICKDNQYLLDEIEVKEIIQRWQEDKDFLSRT